MYGHIVFLFVVDPLRLKLPVSAAVLSVWIAVVPLAVFDWSRLRPSRQIVKLHEPNCSFTLSRIPYIIHVCMHQLASGDICNAPAELNEQFLSFFFFFFE